MIGLTLREMEKQELDKLMASPEYIRRRDAWAQVVLRHFNQSIEITDEMVQRARIRLPADTKTTDHVIRDHLDYAINGLRPECVKDACEPAATPAIDHGMMQRTGELLRNMGVNISASGVASFLAHAIEGKPVIDVTADMRAAGVAAAGSWAISIAVAERVYRAMHAVRPKSAT